ncbi:MAG: response regulator transcription factor [Dehalococcoidia bacterium]|nr:response regulator transcription factor [Dehalococcoidia bacterium]
MVSSQSPLRILIVDDHQMFREGIRRRLEQEPDIVVVGEAASAEDALAKVPQTNPTIVLLDIRLPKVSGIELARRLRQQWPELKILVLSGYDFDQYVRAVARVGVSGYLLKTAPQDAVVQAIREVAAGGAVLPPAIASKVLQHYSVDSSAVRDGMMGELTLRETDVLELMHQGIRNADIAKQLAISPRTVEAHVSNIISKLGAQSRTEAIRVALEKGLIK